MKNVQKLKGFRDFVGVEAKKRMWLKDQMVQIFEKWGYVPMETPTLEPLDLFAGQIGEDEKLFFSFKDNGGRDVALRYDQTVPTCRIMAEKYNELVFPYRRYQIQSVFRAEKPQKGRYREFFQCDADIFGVKNESADAEIIALLLDLYTSLGFKNVKAIINNRELMKDVPYEAIVAIDKLKKIGKEGVIETMINKGITKDKAEDYFYYVENLKPDSVINNIFKYLKDYGFNEQYYSFEPTLARAFSYSEGPIWEIIIPDIESGSVAGGERYDNLLKKISGQDLGATGVGIGFDRTMEALEELKLLPDFNEPTKVLVTIFSPELVTPALTLSRSLREANINTEIYPDPNAKLDKQLKYADKKGVPFVVIIGPEEEKANKVIIKDMKNKTQETIARNDLLGYNKLL